MSRVFGNWQKGLNKRIAPIASCSTIAVHSNHTQINHKSNKERAEGRDDINDEQTTIIDSTKRTVSPIICKIIQSHVY